MSRANLSGLSPNINDSTTYEQLVDGNPPDSGTGTLMRYKLVCQDVTGTSATVKFYDGTDATGTLLTTITVAAGATEEASVDLDYSDGLFVTVTGQQLDSAASYVDITHSDSNEPVRWEALDARLSGTSGPAHVRIMPDVDPVDSTGLTATTTDTNCLGNMRQNSSGAQNDYATYAMAVLAGTYTLELVHTTGADRGIYTFAVSDDGTAWTDVGTIDGYNATIGRNTKSKITGISLDGNERFIRFKMETKNGSSTFYYSSVQAIALQRTAA